MSRKIARITQDKKLLLANEVVEGNAKTSLNSDGRLDIDEIIEYPDELGGRRNLFSNKFYKDINNYDGVLTYRYHLTNLKSSKRYAVRSWLKEGEVAESGFWITLTSGHPNPNDASANGGTYSHIISNGNSGSGQVLARNNIPVYISYYPPSADPSILDKYNISIQQLDSGYIQDWTPAPEDLGLNYPDSIQNFNSSISGNNIIAPELIEGYPFVKPVIDDSLVLWLDGSTGNNYDKTGTWKDLSGNGNDGELVNFAYDEGSGWGDGGLKFDGVDDIVMVPNFNPSIFNNQFTFEMVINISNLMVEGSGYYNNVAGFTSSKKDVHFIINLWSGNRISINLINNNSQIAILTLANSLILNKEIHIMCKYDGGKIDFFINGSKVDLQADDTTIRFLVDYDCLVVGGRRTFSQGYYDGSIYSTRLYNRALTDEEILQNYQAGQCSPLLAMRGDIIG